MAAPMMCSVNPLALLNSGCMFLQEKTEITEKSNFFSPFPPVRLFPNPERVVGQRHDGLEQEQTETTEEDNFPLRFLRYLLFNFFLLL